MAKLNLPTINSGYLSTEALNNAFGQIATAFDNTLSRDGEGPNQMQADLDLNGFTIINTSVDATNPSSLVTREQMQDYISAVSSGLVVQKQELQTATAGQTVFNLTQFEYVPGAHNLAVYVEGVRKFAPVDYTETDADTVTFLSGLTIGQEVEFVTNDFVGNISLPAHTHPWNEITGVPVYTTRWPTYAEVTDKPTTFPPSSHTHDASAITTGRVADARRGVYVQATQPASPQTGDLWFW